MLAHVAVGCFAHPLRPRCAVFSGAAYLVEDAHGFAPPFRASMRARMASRQFVAVTPIAP
jgi:hypothetical protein